MASPTAPTLASICSEALSSAGYSNPSSALTARAQNQWMEEIKNDVFFLAKKLKSLHTTSYAVTTTGVHRYSNPTDYGSEMTLTLLNGTYSGTAQGGSSAGVTLSASETVGSDFIVGKYILITSGTGKNSCSQCISYDTSTKSASVSPNFTTAPVNGDGYLIIDDYTVLSPKPVWNVDELRLPTLRDKPSNFSPIGDADYGEFILYPTPDKVYGLQMRYYANLMTLDLAGTLIGTLYQRWRNIFTQGVYAKALKDMDDVRADNEIQKYNSYLQTLILREQYGVDLSNLQITVRDF